MDDNKLSFSVDKDLIAYAIQSQLSEAASNKNELIVGIVQKVLNSKVNYDGRFTRGYNGEYSFFEYELQRKLQDITSNTIKDVLEKNSSTIKKLIEKEIMSKLHEIAVYLVDTITEPNPRSIRVKVEINK